MTYTSRSTEHNSEAIKEFREKTNTPPDRSIINTGPIQNEDRFYWEIRERSKNRTSEPPIYIGQKKDKTWIFVY